MKEHSVAKAVLFGIAMFLLMAAVTESILAADFSEVKKEGDYTLVIEPPSAREDGTPIDANDVLTYTVSQAGNVICNTQQTTCDIGVVTQTTIYDVMVTDQDGLESSVVTYELRIKSPPRPAFGVGVVRKNNP